MPTAIKDRKFLPFLIFKKLIRLAYVVKVRHIFIQTTTEGEVFMNEKLQYAEMLEIPVNTCNITYKPTKKRLFKGKTKTLEEVKDKVVKKVNDTVETSVLDKEFAREKTAEIALEKYEETDSPTSEYSAENIAVQIQNEYEEKAQKPIEKQVKRKFKLGVIGAQILVVCALVATIILTSVLIPNSGINTLFAGVFGVENQAESVIKDEREYSEFTAAIPVKNASQVTLADGVMSLNGNGSVYAPCKGTVSAVTTDANGKITLEIAHNNNFKTVLKGMDFAYFNEGETVLATIPVGYIEEGGATACFYDKDGAVITDYTLGDNGVVWAV